MDDASLKVEIAVEPDRLRVTCEGPYRQKDVLRLFEDAFEAAEREGRRAILVDGVGVTPPGPGTVDRYDLGLLIARLSARHGWRIRLAVVARVPVLDPDRLAELVATSRMANVRAFEDEGEAAEWLRRAP